MEKKQAIAKAVVLFITEFLFWLLAAVVIGAIIKKDWRALLSNGNFLILAGVFSLISAFVNYTKTTGGKNDEKK